MSETQQEFWWSMIVAVALGVISDGYLWWLIAAVIAVKGM